MIKTISIGPKLQDKFGEKGWEQIKKFLSNYMKPSDISSLSYNEIYLLSADLVQMGQAKPVFRKMLDALFVYLNEIEDLTYDYLEIETCEEYIKRMIAVEEYWCNMIDMMNKIFQPFKVEINQEDRDYGIRKKSKSCMISEKREDMFNKKLRNVYRRLLKHNRNKIYKTLKFLILSDRHENVINIEGRFIMTSSMQYIIDTKLVKVFFEILEKYDIFMELYHQICNKVIEYYLDRVECHAVVSRIKKANTLLQNERRVEYLEKKFLILEKKFLEKFLNGLTQEEIFYLINERKYSALSCIFVFYRTACLKSILIKNIKIYIQKMFSANNFVEFMNCRKVIEEIIEGCFENDDEIILAIEKEFINGIEDNESSLRNKSNEYIDKFLRAEMIYDDYCYNAMTFLFSRSKDSESFEKEYRIYLGNRILSHSVIIDKEEKMLKNFTKVLKYNLVQKIEYMLRDYKNYKENINSEAFMIRMCKWPEYENIEFDIPAELKAIQNRIEKKERKKKLRWINTIGSCIIELNNRTLRISILQYHILTQILNKKSIQEFYLNEHYLELREKGLVNEKNEINCNYDGPYCIIPKFKPTNFKNASQERLVKDEYNGRIDSFLMQIMKREKNVVKSELINQCRSQEDWSIDKIENRIELLIEKGYLGLERGSIKYIP
ncbi:Cullin-4B [Astathelohania contejeani]|uniref:Cullin-4B n=1 Tax=Astathelohania contejeani TaxID=164912 RepID=A0ABQ7HWQ6_9MICR|nr:Cullin-4B [Thelohania contejeani]